MNELFAQRSMFYGRCTCKLADSEADYRWMLGEIYGQEFLNKVELVRRDVPKREGDINISEIWNWRWK